MKIAIIGAGNIATHYAHAFYSLGHEITQIFNKTSANAKTLADAVSSTVIHSLDDLDPNCDLYIIAVTDSAIKETIEQIDGTIEGIIVHTSGATSIQELYKFQSYGIIYPPQSLNKGVRVDWSQIPFAIEGNTSETEAILLKLMISLSEKSFVCNSEQRLALHVSAVFANNFPNLLYRIAESILEKENLDFELIKPIILATAEKVQKYNPSVLQTGPAQREDTKTLQRHLDFLSYSNDLTEIYQLMTKIIIKSK